jgi:hypothetical protein
MNGALALPFGKETVNLRDHGGAFADCRCDALGRSGTNVADREDSRHTGL